MLMVQGTTGGRGWGSITPAFAGLLAAVAAWGITLPFGSARPAAIIAASGSTIKAP